MTLVVPLGVIFETTGSVVADINISSLIHGGSHGKTEDLADARDGASDRKTPHLHAGVIGDDDMPGGIHGYAVRKVQKRVQGRPAVANAGPCKGVDDRT